MAAFPLRILSLRHQTSIFLSSVTLSRQPIPNTHRPSTSMASSNPIPNNPTSQTSFNTNNDSTTSQASQNMTTNENSDATTQTSSNPNHTINDNNPTSQNNLTTTFSSNHGPFDREVTEQILTYLPSPDLVRARLVCKAWNTFILAFV